MRLRIVDLGGRVLFDMTPYQMALICCNAGHAGGLFDVVLKNPGQLFFQVEGHGVILTDPLEPSPEMLNDN